MTIRGNTLRGGGSASAFATMIALAAPAEAAVTISTGATQNMNCANGVCSPMAADAVLNVSDLGNLLASGSTEVTTTGSGVQAKDIVVKAPLTWSTSNALALDAYRSITIDEPVSVAGQSAVTLTTNDGGRNGDLTFGRKGNVTFANLASALTINGAEYTLVNTIHGLANAIANNPSGDYALASSYDGKQDGTYTNNPIPTIFPGTFEGLGNAISHFSMKSTAAQGGFFWTVDIGGVLRDFGLTGVRVRAKRGAGGLAYVNGGNVTHCHVTGSVTSTGGNGVAGGLLASNANTGTIRDSYSTASVKGGARSSVGGLAGNSGGLISESFSTGTVTDPHGGGDFSGDYVGGLVGETGVRSVVNSYATGSVLAGNDRGNPNIVVGGLIGLNDDPIMASYSTGAVTNEGGVGSVSGGLIGIDGAPSGSLSDTYWDTDTSGITNLSQGAGYPPSDPGITGLTTEQLQSGLPAGFDPTVWAEDPEINNGLPYLLNNPPP